MEYLDTIRQWAEASAAQIDGEFIQADLDEVVPQVDACQFAEIIEIADALALVCSEYQLGASVILPLEPSNDLVDTLPDICTWSWLSSPGVQPPGLYVWTDSIFFKPMGEEFRFQLVQASWLSCLNNVNIGSTLKGIYRVYRTLEARKNQWEYSRDFAIYAEPTRR